MPIEWRKAMKAMLDMVNLKDTPGHAEAVRIARELKEAAAANNGYDSNPLEV